MDVALLTHIMFVRLTVVLCGLLPFSRAHADFAVSSVSPERNALHVRADLAVRITLSSAVDPASITSKTLLVFGLWSGVATGTIGVSEDGRVITFVPKHTFSAGEKVSVSVAKSLSGLDGSSLGQGYAWQFWIASSPANIAPIETERISVRDPGDTWIQTYGAYAGDLNGDGSTDFAVPNENTGDVRVFLNNGHGSYGQFKSYPVPEASRPSTNEGADFNRDGHIDFALGNSGGSAVSVFMGDGKGALTRPRAYAADRGVRGLAVLDLNGDGYPDLATANRRASTVSTLINDGTGSFLVSSPMQTPGFGETAASAADMNGDGMLDLVIGSFASDDVQVLIADAQGGLTPHSLTAAGDGIWMIMTGDTNGDGHADVVTANSGDNSVSVLFGDGEGDLTLSRSYDSGAFPLAIDLGDLDGDGDLDMVSSNFGSQETREPGSWRVFENLGDGIFEPAARFTTSGAGSCAVLHDRDNDGALDMTTIDELDDLLILFTNRRLSTATENRDTPGDDAGSAAIGVFPNPSGNAMTIDLSGLSSAGTIIEIYDVAGRRIRTLHDGVSGRTQMRLRWDGLDQSGNVVPPGAYLVRARNGSRTSSRVLTRINR